MLPETIRFFTTRRFWVVFFAVAMSLFHLYTAGTTFLPGMQQRVIHLSFALILVFLLFPAKAMSRQDDTRKLHILDIILVLLSLSIGIYVFKGYEEILTYRMTSPTQLDLVIAALGVALIIEGTRRVCGWLLPIVSFLFIAYAFGGHYLPAMIRHSGFSIERLAGYLFLSTEGIFGVALGVSSTIIILFILFGAFLQNSGGASFLLELSQALTGKYRGGPAKTAIVASALFGTLSGSHVGNVAATGSVTIPLMMRVGYKPHFAAAVESVASTGGMFMPPIMGATAFLIAEILQVHYVEVIKAALIPAILYYLALYVMVDLEAIKTGLKGLLPQQIPSISNVLLRRGHLLIPIFLLIYLLAIVRFTPPKAAFWSIMATILISFLHKETRMKISDILNSLEKGARTALIVVMACASAGIILGVVSVSGLSFRFASILTTLAGENVLILLVLTMFASLILGMGLPAIACYIILAMLVAPALVRMGIEPMAAHLFVFYFGIINAITPPVALAAYTGAAIAGADPNKTGFTALRLGLTGFIIPYMFVFGTSLLMMGSPVKIAIGVITAMIGIIALSFALEGFFKDYLSLIQRIFLLAGALMVIHPNMWIDLIGLAVIILAISNQLFSASSAKEPSFSPYNKNFKGGE